MKAFGFHNRWRDTLRIGGAVGIALFLMQSATADHGRYLPDADPNSATARVHTWGHTSPTAFDRSVVDTTKSIAAGQIRFDYDTYSLNQTGTDGGGAVLSGGFFMNANVRLKPGFSLGWVQTVTATHAGDNEWNLPDLNAGEFPDADPEDRAPGTFGPDDTLLAPTYPFNTPAVNNTPSVPTLGFQDFPARGFADGNQSWVAELGLVCISADLTEEFDDPGTPGGHLFGREVRVIDTLLWGFTFTGINPEAGGSISNISSFGPSSWSNPTGSYLGTLNQYYDGSGGGGGDDGAGGVLPAKASDLYRFHNNDNCFENVPEPTTGVLFVIVGLICARRRAA